MAGKSKRAKYVSKGKYPSVSKETLKSVRQDRTAVDKIMDQLKFWSRGKRTVVTIPNPNKTETNRRFIKVEGNHSGAFGPWKRQDDRKNRTTVND
jgi:hypothetical protein